MGMLNIKAVVFAFLLALTANAELVETCNNFDKRKIYQLLEDYRKSAKCTQA